MVIEDKEMLESEYKEMPNAKKIALLMIALGQRWATEILRHLKENEIKEISYWISKMETVPQSLTEKVINEFYTALAKRASLSTMGGRDYLMNIFTGLMGENKAREVLGEMLDREKYEIFKVLKQVDPKQLAAYLKQEQPQTIALMLSYVEPPRAAAIISALSEDIRVSVIYSMATLEEIDTEVVEAVEQALTANLSTLSDGKPLEKMGGVRVVAELLNNMNESKDVLEKLSEEHFDLAAKIKELMFVFDDIVLLDDKSIQIVLKDVDPSNLVLALKGAQPNAKERIFQNISRRQIENINDELAFLGPVKASAVAEAQQKIVNMIRKLDEEGKILIQGRGGNDEIIA